MAMGRGESVLLLGLVGVAGWLLWRYSQEGQGGGIEFKLPAIPTPLAPADDAAGWFLSGGGFAPTTDQLFDWMMGSASAGGAQMVTKKWVTPAVGEYAPNHHGNMERVVFDGRQYDPVFRDAELKFGLPAGVLSRIAWQESRYNPNAESVLGARGMMQIMPDTAAAYGWRLDDLKVPEKAIRYAARVLRDKYLAVSPRDWVKAIVAYNQGQGTVNRASDYAAAQGVHWMEGVYPPGSRSSKGKDISGQRVIGAHGQGYYQIAVDVGLVPARIAASGVPGGGAVA